MIRPYMNIKEYSYSYFAATTDDNDGVCSSGTARVAEVESRAREGFPLH